MYSTKRKKKGKDQESIHTHYYTGNLICPTVSHRVDEVIPSDHLRCQASRIIKWYGLQIKVYLYFICNLKHGSFEITVREF